MYMTIRRSPYRKNLKARNSSVSRRVDKSLGYVADQMAFALGSHCAGQESQLLCRRLALRELRYLPYLELKYHFENRLMDLQLHRPAAGKGGTVDLPLRQRGTGAGRYAGAAESSPDQGTHSFFGAAGDSGVSYTRWQLEDILREHDWFCDLDIGSAGGEPYQTQRGGVPSLCGIF